MAATVWGVDLVDALAQPVALLVIVIILRGPISTFLVNVSGRLSKLRFAGVEIELIPAVELHPTWKVNMITAVIDVRQPSPSAAFDSYADSLFEQFDDPRPIDYVVIDLGQGENWLSTRLFMFAELLTRMRGVRSFVFVATTGGGDRQFVGMADPVDVRWQLAMEFPILELALVRAYDWTLNQRAQAAPDFSMVDVSAAIIVSSTGALARFEAGSVARTFLQAVQTAAPNPSPPQDWVPLKDPSSTIKMSERARWLDRTAVQKMFATVMSTAQVHESNTANIDRSAQARDILHLSGDLVAVIRQGRFDRLVDRRAMLERLAASHLAEMP